MVINTRLTIDGTDYNDSDYINLDKSTDENNSTSSFDISFNNYNGKYKDTFNLNDEVVIYANKDAAATTKIFTGVIETLDFTEKPNSGRLIIRGRDYGAILQDSNIDPIVYKNKEASVIVKDILSKYVIGITTNNVNTTSTTVERITFNHTNIFDGLIQLAELSGYYFYIDEDKDLHFEEKDSTASGVDIDNKITTASFKIDDTQIYNEVWAYGGRILTGANNRFIADGVGSVYTLDDRPSNTNVFLDDVLQSKGGIYEMDDPAYSSDLKYLVDYDRKQIIFISGAATGDLVPTSGQIISVDYDRSKPILANRSDGTSIASYGHKEKVLIDQNIKTYKEISAYADNFLAQNKDPKIQGIVSINNVINITPGNTIVINVPNQGIVSQTYQIMSVKYKFNKSNNLSDNIITLKLNKLISDISDTIKQLILKQKALDTAGLDSSLTTLREVDDSTTIESHYEVYAISGTNYPFRFHTPGADVFDSPHAVLGPWLNGSSLLQSGGTY